MKKTTIARTFKTGSPSNSTSLLFLLTTIALTIIGCGANSPTKPAGDFGIYVSPGSVSAVVGSTTPDILISANPQDGFTGTISISIQGIPTGVTVMPAATFSVEAGASQSLTFAVSDSAAIGPSAIVISGVSGQLSHSVPLTLTAEAIVRTYQIGSVLYLESGSATDNIEE